MPALALWTPEDGLLGALAPLGLALAAGTALVVDLDPLGPHYPGSASLADLVAEGPRKADLSPARRGVAVLRNGGVSPAAAAEVVAALVGGLGAGGAAPAAPARSGSRRPPGGPGAPAGPGGPLPSRRRPGRLPVHPGRDAPPRPRGAPAPSRARARWPPCSRADARRRGTAGSGPGARSGRRRGGARAGGGAPGRLRRCRCAGPTCWPPLAGSPPRRPPSTPSGWRPRRWTPWPAWGPLEALLADPAVSDVLVNAPDEVWVERAGRLERAAVRFPDAAAVVAAVERAIAPLGLRLDRASPAVAARLPDGSRLHAMIPPASVDGPVVAIRRFTPAVPDLAALVAAGSLRPEGADLLAAAVRGRRSLLVSGGTGSGKTTLLNVLSAEIPAAERVVTIEDAAELRLRGHVVRLEARPPNAEGAGEITLRTLVRHALRLRPDRIVVGEVRGPEALDLIQAMSTGHPGSMGTVHANGPGRGAVAPGDPGAVGGDPPRSRCGAPPTARRRRPGGAPGPPGRAAPGGSGGRGVRGAPAWRCTGAERGGARPGPGRRSAAPGARGGGAGDVAAALAAGRRRGVGGGGPPAAAPHRGRAPPTRPVSCRAWPPSSTPGPRCEPPWSAAVHRGRRRWTWLGPAAWPRPVSPPSKWGRRCRAALPVNGRLAAAAFRLAAVTGGRVAALFHTLAARAAEVGRLNRERRALTAQARASAWVVGGVPLALLAAAGGRPGGSGRLLAEPAGVVVLAVRPGPGGGRGGGGLADGAGDGAMTAVAALAGIGAAALARRLPRLGPPVGAGALAALVVAAPAAGHPGRSWLWRAGASPGASTGAVSPPPRPRPMWCCSPTWSPWAWGRG